VEPRQPSEDPDRLPGTLVFLPGFMTAGSSYRALLAPLQEAGLEVVVPRLYRPGWRALSGRFTVVEEAVRAREVVTALGAEGRAGPIWLGGHSRGGQAAWRCAELLAGGFRDGDNQVGPPPRAGSGSNRTIAYPRGSAIVRLPTGNVPPGGDTPVLAGLILVDPVDGSGRRPPGPEACAKPATFHLPTLIIGAGRGGFCAPEVVNHDVFATATPAATHVVVADLGHADVLCGPALTLGRALCGGGSDPSAGRRHVGRLMLAAISDAQSEGSPPG
jgi:pimeloyl-ACP methyl ester carboxylesterase